MMKLVVMLLDIVFMFIVLGLIVGCWCCFVRLCGGLVFLVLVWLDLDWCDVVLVVG